MAPVTDYIKSEPLGRPANGSDDRIADSWRPLERHFSENPVKPVRQAHYDMAARKEKRDEKKKFDPYSQKSKRCNIEIGTPNSSNCVSVSVVFVTLDFGIGTYGKPVRPFFHEL